MTNYSESIDKLMSSFSSGKYADEVARAKSEFFKSAGVFDEESIDLEMKIHLFSEWYLFQRKLTNSDKTPIQLAADKTFEMTDAEAEEFKLLGDNRHSLFEFIKVKNEDVYIKDLFSGYKMVLKKSPVVVGFRKEEIFEARLFPAGDSFVFSSAFCIHPSDATKFIKKEIKKIKKLDSSEQDQAREDLIFRLLEMRYKIEQYKHVDLSEIYANDSKLRV